MGMARNRRAPAEVDHKSIDTTIGEPEVLRIRLLGGFRISVGTRIVEEEAWHLRKAAGLVKLLALAPGHRLHREQAMDALWSDLTKRAASNNLRQALYAARGILDPPERSRYLASENGSLILGQEGSLWVDAEAFEEAAIACRRERSPSAYEAAIEQYAGELLPGDRHEVWTQSRREELRRLHLALLLELVATWTVARSASGDFPRGLRVFRFRSALWTPRVLGRLARQCGRGSREGRSGAFLEPSAVGLSPPSSDPGFALFAPALAPSAARGYPCTTRALRGHGNAPSYPPNSLRHQGRSCGL
jgi:hypothetical protein